MSGGNSSELAAWSMDPLMGRALDKWAEIYGLTRRPNEPDDDFRRRLLAAVFIPPIGGSS